MNLRENREKIKEMVEKYGFKGDSNNVTAYEKLDQILINQYLILSVLSSQGTATWAMGSSFDKAIKQTESCLASCIMK